MSKNALERNGWDLQETFQSSIESIALRRLSFQKKKKKIESIAWHSQQL